MGSQRVGEVATGGSESRPSGSSENNNNNNQAPSNANSRPSRGPIFPVSLDNIPATSSQRIHFTMNSDGTLNKHLKLRQGGSSMNIKMRQLPSSSNAVHVQQEQPSAQQVERQVHQVEPPMEQVRTSAQQGHQPAHQGQSLIQQDQTRMQQSQTHVQQTQSPVQQSQTHAQQTQSSVQQSQISTQQSQISTQQSQISTQQSQTPAQQGQRPEEQGEIQSRPTDPVGNNINNVPPNIPPRARPPNGVRQIYQINPLTGNLELRNIQLINVEQGRFHLHVGNPPLAPRGPTDQPPRPQGGQGPPQNP
ncbi:transcription factor mef2A-like [Belonocnema kinseyi]|uniref:transcription factor mef2A-like n=1 Tax=Belonocnema kinseyi TaxID=2817044 RepID=UPI00143E0471|nr:transcription factor mef2A-like [Belonocnema kinseyi]